MILREMADKRSINQYTVMIANHTNPGNIDGCQHCPSGDYTKVAFNTGWVIVYRLIESEIHFLDFYRHTPAH